MNGELEVCVADKKEFFTADPIVKRCIPELKFERVYRYLKNIGIEHDAYIRHFCYKLRLDVAIENSIAKKRD